jgi:hypothetical protein
MTRRWNLWIYLGFLLTLAGFLSYFMFFSRFAALRDFPWLNLPLQVVGVGMVLFGFWRAYARPTQYRGKLAAPIFSLLSIGTLALFCFYVFSLSYRVPPANSAPQVGQVAPDFTLPDHNSEKVQLASFFASSSTEASPSGVGHYVLLVFYRGYW